MPSVEQDVGHSPARIPTRRREAGGWVERPEALEAGCALLIGAERTKIVEQVMRLSGDTATYASMARAGNPFGDGTASRQIVSVLARHFQAQEVTATETV